MEYPRMLNTDLNRFWPWWGRGLTEASSGWNEEESSGEGALRHGGQEASLSIKTRKVLPSKPTLNVSGNILAMQSQQLLPTLLSFVSSHNLDIPPRAEAIWYLLELEISLPTPTQLWVLQLCSTGSSGPRRKWQPTPVFLPGKSHGQRSLIGYSPWGRKESDMT